MLIALLYLKAVIKEDKIFKLTKKPILNESAFFMACYMDS